MIAEVRLTPRSKVIVGREPVFGPDLEILGYALAAASVDGNTISATLTEDLAYTPPTIDGDTSGLPSVFGSKLAFVRPDRNLLHAPETLARIVPPESTVVEVGAEEGPVSELVDCCRGLARYGYRIAIVDLPAGADDTGPLLESASYMKVETGGVAPQQLKHHVEQAKEMGLRSVAVGVHDLQQLRAARLSGFELFEGHLLSRPVVVMTEALTPSRLTVLRMIEAVNDPGTSAADLQRVVEADAGLSYRLLHISSLGAAGGLRRPVHSIREATVLLGRDWIYRWLILMLVADANQGVPEQLTIAMTRARMAELVASWAGLVDQDSAFTVGLLSALDLVLGAPRAEIVSKLAITDDLVEALLEEKGRLGAVLHDVLAWEVGDAAGANRSGLDGQALERRYLAALAYAQSLTDTLERAEAAI